MDTEMAEPELETCGTLAAVERLVRSQPAVFLRYSRGPRDDLGHRSMDGESGLPLPGLSVNPLTPEDWWTRPLRHWLARQLVQYRHLADEHDRIAWALTGRISGRGPDSEPLIADPRPLAIVAEPALDEADALYSAVFQRGKHPAEREDTE